MTLNDVLEKFFKGEKTLNYTGSDKLEMIESNHTISYEKIGGVAIFKSSEDGECCLGVYQDAEVLNTLLEILIYKS